MRQTDRAMSASRVARSIRADEIAREVARAGTYIPPRPERGACGVTDRQADLFSGAGIRWDAAFPDTTTRPPLAAAELDDAALIAALPGCGLADCRGLAAEAGRRRLLG